jgi:FKBP-type peptidyl-prolyl cis-trans isomerase 2
MTTHEIIQLIATLADDYDFDCRYAEQGCAEDSAIIRSDCERYEVVVDFGEDTATVHFNDPDTGTTIKVETDMRGLLEAVENVSEAVSTLGI